MDYGGTSTLFFYFFSTESSFAYSTFCCELEIPQGRLLLGSHYVTQPEPRREMGDMYRWVSGREFGLYQGSVHTDKVRKKGGGLYCTGKGLY